MIVPIPVGSNTCSLYSCLDLYFAAENDVAEYTCLHCNIEGGVSKTFRLFVTPEILMITLKRFDGFRYKNECFIEFPMHNLNLKKYLVANCDENELNFMYDLYAVVRHSGSLHGGHYTAACKQQNKWYSFDDSIVKEIGEVSVNSASAYILFYKKKNNQVDALVTDVVVFSDDVKQIIIFPAIRSIYVDDVSYSAPRWVRLLSIHWKPELRLELVDDFGDVRISYTELENYHQAKNFVCSTGVQNLTNDEINEILCLQSPSTATESSIQHKFGAALIDAILLYENSL